MLSILLAAVAQKATVTVAGSGLCVDQSRESLNYYISEIYYDDRAESDEHISVKECAYAINDDGSSHRVAMWNLNRQGIYL